MKVFAVLLAVVARGCDYRCTLWSGECFLHDHHNYDHYQMDKSVDAFTNKGGCWKMAPLRTCQGPKVSQGRLTLPECSKKCESISGCHFIQYGRAGHSTCETHASKCDCYTSSSCTFGTTNEVDWNSWLYTTNCHHSNGKNTGVDGNGKQVMCNRDCANWWQVRIPHYWHKPTGALTYDSAVEKCRTWCSGVSGCDGFEVAKWGSNCPGTPPVCKDSGEQQDHSDKDCGNWWQVKIAGQFHVSIAGSADPVTGLPGPTETKVCRDRCLAEPRCKGYEVGVFSEGLRCSLWSGPCWLHPHAKMHQYRRNVGVINFYNPKQCFKLHTDIKCSGGSIVRTNHGMKTMLECGKLCTNLGAAGCDAWEYGRRGSSLCTGTDSQQCQCNTVKGCTTLLAGNTERTPVSVPATHVDLWYRHSLTCDASPDFEGASNLAVGSTATKTRSWFGWGILVVIVTLVAALGAAFAYFRRRSSIPKEYSAIPPTDRTELYY